MEYRVKYRLYRIDGTDAVAAKKAVCDLMRQHPEQFISVEQEQPKRGILKTLFLG